VRLAWILQQPDERKLVRKLFEDGSLCLRPSCFTQRWQDKSSAARLDYNQIGLTVVRRRKAADGDRDDNRHSHGIASGPALNCCRRRSPFLSADEDNCLLKTSFWNKRDMSADISLPASNTCDIFAILLAP
jgi:hypothetical protein